MVVVEVARLGIHLISLLLRVESYQLGRGALLASIAAPMP